MKILKCPKCGEKQKTGRFCLNDGTELQEIITSEVKFMPIETKRTYDQLRRDVRKWLARLGVQNSDIQIRASEREAEVQYIIGKNKYKFTSNLQKSMSSNLAAVEQFLHGRVLGIERGIETTEDAFAGYEQLPDYSNSANINPYQALGFAEKVDIEEARKKFRELVKKYHPDLNKNKDTHVEFQRIKTAMNKIEAEQ